MMLTVLLALVLAGGLAYAAIRRARAEDLTLLVRVALVSLTVLALGALALHMASPADLPDLLRTAVRTLR